MASVFTAPQAELTENGQWFWVLRVFMPLIWYLKMEVLKTLFLFFFLSAANLKVAGACARGKVALRYLKGL